MSSTVPDDHATAPAGGPGARVRLAAFQAPSVRRAILQIGTTLPPYVAIVVAMYFLAEVSTWLTLALAVPAAGFVVRTFIIQHDCGHGSFFRSTRANKALGWVCSAVTMTPFTNWRRHHANHHAVWNNLDRRTDATDMYSTCLTVDEYRALPGWNRFTYRLLRHPVVSTIVIPPILFILLFRMPFDTPKSWRTERRSIYATDLALAGIFLTLILTIGLGPVVLVQLPIMVLASIAGVWLFSVQHKFDDAEWSRQPDWDVVSASLRGTSNLGFPGLIRWFTGNIGFHHLHHLAPRIPSYRLPECHAACPEISGQARVLTLREALLHAPRFMLWDEAAGRMVRFNEV